MQFKNFEDKCFYYRSLSDYKLLPNSYVMVMLDGRSFSSKIKKKFARPFDKCFTDMMDETAKYLLKNVQGCKFAYTQSDEISLALTDFDTPTTDAFFGNRLCKLQSVIASMATAKFNNLMMQYELMISVKGCQAIAEKIGLYEFDCKAWNVPTYNDVLAWLLYRQNDCIKNSKQQTAQTYLSHKELMGKNTDEQIRLLLETKEIDWNTFPDEWKYGRFVYKVERILTSPEGQEYTRYYPDVFAAYPLNDEKYRENFNSLNIIPKLV